MKDNVKLYLIALELNLDTSSIILNENDTKKISKLCYREKDTFKPIKSILKDYNFETKLEKVKKVNNEIDLDKYRVIFKGIRQGSMGIKADVHRKLTEAMLKYNVDFETICELAEQHVNEAGKYANSANYFLKKLVTIDNKKVIRSTLEDMLLNSENTNKFYDVI